MHQVAGSRDRCCRRAGQGKRWQIAAPLNPNYAQARSRELTVLVRMTTKS